MIKIICIFIIGFSCVPLQKCPAQIFSPVGDGFNQPVAKLFADTINNVVYAGGYFTPTISVPCKSFCMWNGIAWDSLNNNLTGDIRGINILNNDIFINGGGTYDTIINQWVGGPLMLDQSTSTWIPISSSTQSFSNIYNYNGSLYFMGTFDTLGGIASWRIVRYDGQNWFSYPPLDPNGYSILDAASYNGELYVGGNFSAFGMNDIAKWNGSQWVEVGGGVSGPFTIVRSFELFQNKLIVGGNFKLSYGDPGDGILAWNGFSWEQLSTGIDGEIRCMTTYHNELWVGGGFTTAGGIPCFNLAKWDGNQWYNVGLSPNNVVNSFCVLNDELYIGGGFINVINGDTAKRIMKYSDQTGLESFLVSDNLLSVTPNPSDGLFFIHLNDVSKHDVLIEVMDLLGHTIFNDQILAGEKEMYIMLPASTTDGIYYCKIKFKNGSIIKKIVICK